MIAREIFDHASSPEIATQKGYSRKVKLEDICDQEKHKHVVLGKCIFWTAWIGWN